MQRTANGAAHLLCALGGGGDLVRRRTAEELVLREYHFDRGLCLQCAQIVMVESDEGTDALTVKCSNGRGMSFSHASTSFSIWFLCPVYGRQPSTTCVRWQRKDSHIPFQRDQPAYLLSFSSTAFNILNPPGQLTSSHPCSAARTHLKIISVGFSIVVPFSASQCCLNSSTSSTHRVSSRSHRSYPTHNHRAISAPRRPPRTARTWSALVSATSRCMRPSTLNTSSTSGTGATLATPCRTPTAARAASCVNTRSAVSIAPIPKQRGNVRRRAGAMSCCGAAGRAIAVLIERAGGRVIVLLRVRVVWAVKLASGASPHGERPAGERRPRSVHPVHAI